MHERLVELWLDRASERSYQAPFCQALVNRGYTVLHSTRHAPLEFGKDVIARAPDGRLVAYQLKGHPGTRLTHAALREVMPQLIELVNTPIIHPGMEPESHDSFLVTNGEVDEEARVLLDQFNDKNIRSGQPERTVKIIARGEMLRMFNELGTSLWPAELDDIAALAKMMSLDGRGRLPVELLCKLLYPVLGLTPDAATLRETELKRRITAAAILTSVAVQQFEGQANHAALVEAWVMYYVSVVSALERYGADRAGAPQGALDTARATVHGWLGSMARELLDDPSCLHGRSPWADGMAFKARATLVAGLLSVFFVWNDQEGWPAEVDRADLGKSLDALRSKKRLFLWGDGVVPQLLAYYWQYRRRNASWQTERFLIGMLRAAMPVMRSAERDGLAPPYFSYEDVARHLLRNVLPGPDPLRREALGSSSFFAYSLFLLLVRTNRKTSCRVVWPSISRLARRAFYPTQPWEYCLYRCSDGKNVTIVPQRTLRWDDAIAEARSSTLDEVPEGLKIDPVMLLLFTIFVPWRATSNVVLYLGRCFDRTWY